MSCSARPGDRHPFPREDLRRSLGGRRQSHDRRRNGQGRDQGSASDRGSRRQWRSRRQPFSRSSIADSSPAADRKAEAYPALTLTVIHAQERGEPKNRKKIDWKLITDLAVQSRQDAVEKLHWYAMRWKIEVFHKILKSGCKAEESKLRTAERLVNLISIFCILSWRIFWMTMLNRSRRTAAAKSCINAAETRCSIIS